LAAGLDLPPARLRAQPATNLFTNGLRGASAMAGCRDANAPNDPTPLA